MNTWTAKILLVTAAVLNVKPYHQVGSESTVRFFSGCEPRVLATERFNRKNRLLNTEPPSHAYQLWRYWSIKERSFMFSWISDITLYKWHYFKTWVCSTSDERDSASILQFKGNKFEYSAENCRYKIIFLKFINVYETIQWGICINDYWSDIATAESQVLGFCLLQKNPFAFMSSWTQRERGLY